MPNFERIDYEALKSIREREDAEFTRSRPRSLGLVERGKAFMPHGVPMSWNVHLYEHPTVYVAGGQGAYFEDVDGHRYLDMNQSDLSSYLGFSPPPVTEALSAQGARGPSFLLAIEDGLVACEDLAKRTGLPFWQFTGSASTANAEVIRLARIHTGRERVLMFHGKYHGDVEDTLVRSDDGETKAEALGLASGVTQRGASVPFNDLAALEAALAPGDIACVLAEPMLTNCNLVFADPGFWKEARALIHAAGSLLVIDEAHTHSFAFGGLTRAWEIEPDVLTIGKGLGTGLPFGLYGITEPLARLIEDQSMPPSPASPGGVGVAIGGTTYGSALIQAAARAALEQCLTPDDYDRVEGLGRKLSAGLEAIFERRGLPWCSPQIGGRATWQLGPDLPRNVEQARALMEFFFINTRRVFMANRGIWEAIDTAGPACSFSHTDADVEHYLAVSEEFAEVATTSA